MCKQQTQQESLPGTNCTHAIIAASCDQKQQQQQCRTSMVVMLAT
jgi:hypothetical protein